jgi:formimidoylglutamate deiminase
MSRYHLKSVLVGVSDEGIITEINAAPAGGRDGNPAGHPAATVGAGRIHAERIDGIVVPGMSNAHSHAFQRGMAGNTEYRSSARDSFWTWRSAMYALANRIEHDDLQILATQLFVEMLRSGYTSVAEFHYLHRQRDGVPYPGANALWEAIGNAASTAGIGLTLLPDTDTFLRAVEDRVDGERRGRGPRTHRTGVAFHSLRAVPVETLRQAALRLQEIAADMPIHIHVAEQLLEVKACKRETGLRPIELLLETGLLTPHWCLVHATHATAEELVGLAAAAATVCLSISTEANLGDGFFDTARFLKAGGRLCVGSDSQSTVSPAEELRWLEYQQRLRKRRRAVLASKEEPHVGTRLWVDAARHGAHAIGQPAGAIEVGRRADWLVLDDAHASMAGATADTALDHLVFAGGEAAIRDVMVGGRWVIKDRHHAIEEELRPRFAGLMERLAMVRQALG